MKQNTHSIALLFFLLSLVTATQTLGRSLTTKQGEEEPRLNQMNNGGSLVGMEENDSMNLNDFQQQLMGLENCHSEDEECLKRRVAAEAHLDYIYTQHHKP